jgi:hypothetical protein
LRFKLLHYGVEVKAGEVFFGHGSHISSGFI